MATSPHFSPTPPPPDPSDGDLNRSLLRLARDISQFDSAAVVSAATPTRTAIGGRNFASVARKAKLLAVLFEDLLHLFDDDAADAESPARELPRSASLCLREILLVLQRFKALLGDCSARSRGRLLLQAESAADDFHDLTTELSTLLDILPVAELPISDDVRDLVGLLRRQCQRSSPTVDPTEDALRREILTVIADVEREIVPDRAKLEDILRKLGLDDAEGCRDEIESLEREIGDRAAVSPADEKWTSAMVALVGLLRYAKCVLFGASTPISDSSSKITSLSSSSSLSTATAASASSADITVPADFRCPISLDLMKDPVVVATGQTYDRESITRWIGSGHATCPKSGQTLANLELVPNRALKNLIAKWCRENNVPFEGMEVGTGKKSESISRGSDTATSSSNNKAAMEAARMTVSFLVKKLAGSSSTEAASRVVHELRLLSKSGSDNRAFIAEAGAIPLLLPLIDSEDAGLQVNAVTALLNLSILEANKKRIMHTDGGVDGIVRVLADGHSWRAKENAVATVLSLSAVHSYRRKLGRHPCVVKELVKLIKTGPVSTKKDAMAAILSLAGDRENIGKLVEGKVVEAAMEAMGVTEVAAEAVAVVAALAKRGGVEAVWGAAGVVRKLAKVMRLGTSSEWARENAAAALVILCRRMGGEAVAELAAVPGIEWSIWELMGAGTERARRKAASLGRICRRWAAAVEADRTSRLSSGTTSVAPAAVV